MFRFAQHDELQASRPRSDIEDLFFSGFARRFRKRLYALFSFPSPHWRGLEIIPCLGSPEVGELVQSA